MNATAASTFDCSNCMDMRVVDHERLGPIRCPVCTRRTPKTDRSGLEQITKDEAERREQRVIDSGYRPMVGLACAIGLLYQWGRMVRDHGIGFPSMSTTEKARIGRGGGLGFEKALPSDIEAVDRAVSTAPADYKAVLVEHYTKHGYASEKAAHLGISRQTYYQRKAAAERHIATAIGA